MHVEPMIFHEFIIVLMHYILDIFISRNLRYNYFFISKFAGYNVVCVAFVSVSTISSEISQSYYDHVANNNRMIKLNG